MSIKIDLGYQAITDILQNGWTGHTEAECDECEGGRTSAVCSECGDSGLIITDRNGSDLVIEAKLIKLEIDYPISKPVKFTFTSDTGFTRKALAEIIANTYREIYDDEKDSTTVTPGNVPGMLNRNRTNGRYGIWGHDIGDLILHSAHVYADVVAVGLDS